MPSLRFILGSAIADKIDSIDRFRIKFAKKYRFHRYRLRSLGNAPALLLPIPLLRISRYFTNGLTSTDLSMLYYWTNLYRLIYALLLD
jgi:hypothetical protein